MSAKHTPGPWTLRGKRLDVGTDTYCVASDWGGSNWKNDARLIAAAPELLGELVADAAGLELLATDFDVLAEDDPVRTEAEARSYARKAGASARNLAAAFRAAIAKATKE